MLRRIGTTVAILFLAITGSAVTAGPSQAEILKGGLYGTAHTCYNAINNSDDLKAHRSYCKYVTSTQAWSIYQWIVGDDAYIYGGQYGRLDSCYNGIYGDSLSESAWAFCQFGSDRVYHIYFAY